MGRIANPSHVYMCVTFETAIVILTVCGACAIVFPVSILVDTHRDFGVGQVRVAGRRAYFSKRGKPKGPGFWSG